MSDFPTKNHANRHGAWRSTLVPMGFHLPSIFLGPGKSEMHRRAPQLHQPGAFIIINIFFEIVYQMPVPQRETP